MTFIISLQKRGSLKIYVYQIQQKNDEEFNTINGILWEVDKIIDSSFSMQDYVFIKLT